MTGRKLLTLAALALICGPALAATPVAPPPAAPRPYEPPKAQLAEEPSCLAETVQSDRADAGILIRNTCALRVNFALCVRRSDDTASTITRGSLSPADVYQQAVKFGSKTQTFHHASTFCPGLTCQVADPTC